MYAFAATIIAGMFSMAFSKKVEKPAVLTKSPYSFYDLNFNDINGDKIDLAGFKGKKIMIVNVASQCGYTSQYKDLQKLYGEIRENLEIIAIPCNDFGAQESGTNLEIRYFCETNYGITFTMGSKQNIKSQPTSSLYHWLSNPKLNGWNSSLPSWNFCKYIIDENGNLTHYLRSSVNPRSEEMINILKS